MTMTQVSFEFFNKLRVCLPQHPFRKSFQMKISVEFSSFSPPCMRFHRKILYSVDVLADKFHEFPSLPHPHALLFVEVDFYLERVKQSSLSPRQSISLS
jgi:hypothetical protein